MSNRDDAIIIKADYTQYSILIDIQFAVLNKKDISKLFDIVWDFSNHVKGIRLEVSDSRKELCKQWICWVSNIDLFSSFSSELVDKIKKELHYKDIKFSNFHNLNKGSYE